MPSMFNARDVGDNPVTPGDVIDWSYFFDTRGSTADETAQAGRPVDALISDRLFVLPVAALPPGPDANGKDSSTERNLPRRNLMRASEETSPITGSLRCDHSSVLYAAAKDLQGWGPTAMIAK